MSMNPMTRVFIGKEIPRSGGLSNDDRVTDYLPVLADGEIIIVNANKDSRIGGTPTYASGSESTLFVIQGLPETVTITNDSGTTLTARKILTSDPIEGRLVKTYQGRPYAAPVEKIATFDFAGSAPIAEGTEYVLRLIYKDMAEHPGQYVQEYRIINYSTSPDDLGAAIADKVNKHKGARITADYTTPTLTLTAKQIPECTTSLNNIDEYHQVDFEAVLYYVDANGNWRGFLEASYNDPYPGDGNWYQVRDAEKHELGYLGVTNRTQFPVIRPDFRTVKGQAYDTIVIEHDVAYVAPNNQGAETVPTRTILYLAVPVSGDHTGLQTEDILTVLNSWMGSLPQKFEAITL